MERKSHAALLAVVVVVLLLTAAVDAGINVDALNPQVCPKGRTCAAPAGKGYTNGPKCIYHNREAACG